MTDANVAPAPSRHPYKPGDTVPFHFTWYIILLSYFVSLAGSMTTVELLQKRRPGRGWRSWLQLGACSVSFGLVAIWCMHFVGNRAIVLGDGEPELQLYYNPSFTALSVFLPIVVLFCAFMIAEFKGKGKTTVFLYLVASGLVTGLAVTGMHYIGNFGIVNYQLYNPARFIVGAAAVAIVASIVALTLFFVQKELWINSLWRRCICAIILAGAVSGMHWLASIGTQYRLIGERHGSLFERNLNLIVAVVMAVLACVTCAIIAYIAQRRRQELADRAQHVILASITFDPEGKLLVTTEGLLPSERITRQFNDRSFEDEFNTDHGVFHWLFRVTHDWPSVVDLIPAMRRHLCSIRSSEEQHSDDDSASGALDGLQGCDSNYSMIFRELFCVAAADLAKQMNDPIQDLGVLFDSIVTTGKLRPNVRRKHGSILTLYGSSGSSHTKSIEDIESVLTVPAVYGKGQVLFLVRHIDRNAASRLTSLGFRFANINHVGGIIARSMQISLEEVIGVVKKLQVYSQQNQRSLPSGGTFLACFAIRAVLCATKNSSPKWEVLVQKDSPSNLPTVELSPVPLRAGQLNSLMCLDGLPVTQCINKVLKMSENAVDEERTFLQRVHSTILALEAKVPEPFFQSAVFTARSFTFGSITLYPFCVISDVHNVFSKSDDLAYTPLSFFKVRQQAHLNSPDHAVRIHQEFGPILSRNLTKIEQPVSKGRIRNSIALISRNKWPFSRLSGSGASVHTNPDNPSDQPSGQSFGGIMVSSDVTVDTKEDAQLELHNLGTTAEVSVAVAEQPTFVDELFRAALARRQS